MLATNFKKLNLSNKIWFSDLNFHIMTQHLMTIIISIIINIITNKKGVLQITILMAIIQEYLLIFLYNKVQKLDYQKKNKKRTKIIATCYNQDTTWSRF